LRLQPTALKKGVIAALFLLVSFLIYSIIDFSQREPFDVLPAPDPQIVAKIQASIFEAGRRLDHVILHSNRLGDIGLAVSLPDPLPDRKLPLVIVLGGLGTGEHNIRQVSAPGEVAIVGYDWPLPAHLESGLRTVAKLPRLHANVMAIPAAIVSGLHWLLDQPWADRRISLLGFSLGALAAPAAQDMAERDGISIGWTIIAYGGAPFGALIENHPYIKPYWIRPVCGKLADFILRPLEPAWHLPRLHGQFLVLEGKNDTLISAEARRLVRLSVPEPKTIIVFDSEHMGVGSDKRALLEKIVAASRNWLAAAGAIGRR
jgi:dienelactone hydrolase